MRLPRKGPAGCSDLAMWSREENASKQESSASVLIQSEPIMLEA
jgi:hypothetical protein